jgi:hypothetical protein
MRRLEPRLCLVLALTTACGGGGSSSTAPPTNLVTNGTFAATLNGTRWSALGKVVVSRPTSTSLAFFATSTTYAMTGVVLNVTGPGSTSLVSSPSNGSQWAVSQVGPYGWSTGITGGTGTFVVTALSATHVAGTFTFDAPSESGTKATTTLHVTSGTLDLTF